MAIICAKKELLNSDKNDKKSIKFIKLLRDKLSEKINKPYEFKTLQEWGLTAKADKIQKQFTPQELEQIRQGVK